MTATDTQNLTLGASQLAIKSITGCSLQLRKTIPKTSPPSPPEFYLECKKVKVTLYKITLEDKYLGSKHTASIVLDGTMTAQALVSAITTNEASSLVLIAGKSIQSLFNEMNDPVVVWKATGPNALVPASVSVSTGTYPYSVVPAEIITVTASTITANLTTFISPTGVLNYEEEEAAPADRKALSIPSKN